MTADAVNHRSRVTTASHAVSLLTFLFDSSWQMCVTQTDLLVQPRNSPLNIVSFAILTRMCTHNHRYIRSYCVGNGHITAHLLWVIWMKFFA